MEYETITKLKISHIERETDTEITCLHLAVALTMLLVSIVLLRCMVYLLANKSNESTTIAIQKEGNLPPPESQPYGTQFKSLLVVLLAFAIYV